MILKKLRNNYVSLYVRITMYGLLFFASGCASLGLNQGILISREQQWTIPKGVEFKAIQKPTYTELTGFIADEDLAIVYKGTLIELEEEANRRAIKAGRTAKTKGALFGSLGSLLAIVAGLVTKSKLKKKKGAK